jgi:hypothetical protein
VSSTALYCKTYTLLPIGDAAAYCSMHVFFGRGEIYLSEPFKSILAWLNPMFFVKAIPNPQCQYFASEGLGVIASNAAVEHRATSSLWTMMESVGLEAPYDSPSRLQDSRISHVSKS